MSFSAIQAGDIYDATTDGSNFIVDANQIPPMDGINSVLGYGGLATAFGEDSMSQSQGNTGIRTLSQLTRKRTVLKLGRRWALPYEMVDRRAMASIRGKVGARLLHPTVAAVDSLSLSRMFTGGVER